jgi:O-acetyl-ADP-ribose deacetylase (regulator of RNase III)
MSGRIRIREGEIAGDDADAVVGAERCDLAAGEASIRAALRDGLERARARGCRSVAVPALGAGGRLPLQRCAEILLEEARGHLAGDTCIEEIRFVVRGEPALRVFEAVNDAARIAEQAARWS